MILPFNIRKYGRSPFTAAVLHGGPGAPGYMAPVARELACTIGVLEPLQTRDSLEGQIAELAEQLTANADRPVTLIGSSWGAVLALFLAARYGNLTDKIILVGSAVFDSDSSAKIEGVRLSRMSADKRRRYEKLRQEFILAPADKRDRVMAEWGHLLDQTDQYHPLPAESEALEVQYDLHTKVWTDFISWRDRPGALKAEFGKITAPVVVIHGEYDPHPLEGIRPFLESCLPYTRFYILPRCGHYPWIEKYACHDFFEILKSELKKNEGRNT
nr:alpha/beta hydrolase [candidate division Zixibacteria bacterium]